MSGYGRRALRASAAGDRPPAAEAAVGADETGSQKPDRSPQRFDAASIPRRPPQATRTPASNAPEDCRNRPQAPPGRQRHPRRRRRPRPIAASAPGDREGSRSPEERGRDLI